MASIPIIIVVTFIGLWVSNTLAFADLSLGMSAYEQKNYSIAFKELLPYAEKGNALAQDRIGSMYEKGKGISQNYKEARAWYGKAAKQGIAQAQNNLGVLYHVGAGGIQNYKVALMWYQKAAEQGERYAQYNVGLLYETGEGVVIDIDAAIKWYGLAAEKNHTGAQKNLAKIYIRGIGGHKNLEKAFKWGLKVATKGDAEYQTNIGLMYSKGMGVAKNYSNASRWFYEAASQGVPLAQLNLGILYVSGKVLDPRKSFGYMWLEIARQNGVEKAGQILTQVETKLKPEIVAEAKKLATEWFTHTKKNANGKRKFVYSPPSEGKVSFSKFSPKIINIQTEGNLSSTRSTGCVEIDTLNSNEIPPNMYRGISECIESGEYEKAMKLRFLARLYGAFDGRRISDRTAGQGIIVLEMNTFSTLSKDNRLKIQNWMKENFQVGGKIQSSFCKTVAKLGYPKYHPEYLIRHGINFSSVNKSTVIKADFNAEETWSTLLERGCKNS